MGQPYITCTEQICRYYLHIKIFQFKMMKMVLFEQIRMKNCRLCHTKPGQHDIKTDKKLVKEIYECTKVNDKSMELLPRSVCEECKKTIKCFSLYKQHIRKVDQCFRKILKNFDANKHKEIKAEEVFKCDQCPGEFNDYDLLKNHLNSHKINVSLEEIKADVSCPKCDNKFCNLEEYGSHNCFTEEGNTQNEDGNNEKNFNSDDIFENTTETETSEAYKKAKYVCTWTNCKKILSSAYTLKTHELKHQGKRSFLCVTCGKGFITKNSLTCHEKIHLEVKGYICKICNIGFSVRSNLRAHEKKHHEGVRFYCSQCSKAFVSKCSLERHERIHTGIKEFKCQSCPSAFYTKKELLKHQRYHQGLRLHKCDECFKTFFERHHLIIHLRSHTGERPYVCQFPNCGKSFTESQKLKRHHNAKHAQT
ncbi:zinc finger protein OZF-like isoform X2 [Tribolium madens]|uniref:zinc finger protein OZF-like isoform X2 n=1 Tax=Tribolium madens TaxID=41895 RepID=UPI001CF74D8C|nr:zinc finger protein OZF-like isoform X2 [Tribolium madens]